jgi:glycerol-3-phosphate cytidylyltransferase
MTAYTYGVYDLFHVGHIKLFQRIKENCDKLIVGVHNDEQVMSYKNKPIISYIDRLEIIKCCKYVDEVYENADLITTDDLLYKLNADNVFAGKENADYIKKYYQVSQNKLILLDRTTDICTSDIIKKIKNH